MKTIVDPLFMPEVLFWYFKKSYFSTSENPVLGLQEVPIRDTNYYHRNIIILNINQSIFLLEEGRID